MIRPALGALAGAKPHSQLAQAPEAREARRGCAIPEGEPDTGPSCEWASPESQRVMCMSSIPGSILPLGGTSSVHQTLQGSPSSFRGGHVESPPPRPSLWAPAVLLHTMSSVQLSQMPAQRLVRSTGTNAHQGLFVPPGFWVLH
ncbi:unnamed protein product [Eretmochelys imbricata]